jgi:cobalt-zinc-cadmium efflux system outer membrane protein
MYQWSLITLFMIATSAYSAPNDNEPPPISLTLSAAEARLASGNRDLIASRQALEGARADRLIAGQRPNPSVSLTTLSIDPRRLGAGQSGEKSVDTALQFSQPIERGGKRDLRTAAADHSALAASSDVEVTRRQQLLNLRQAYFDLHLAQERISIGQSTVMAYRRTLDAARFRLRSGDIASADVSRISVDALRSENDVRLSLADLARAKVGLAYLIGLDALASNIEAIDPWPAIEPVPAAPSDEVLDHRPDVRAAAERAHAAAKTAQLAVAQRSRDVTVFAQFETFPGQPQNRTIGFGVSVPLFLNHSYDGEIRRAESDRYAARDNLERVRALALADIGRARADLASARERVERFDNQLLASARKAAEAAEFAYQRGALGVMDLLDARRSLNAIQLDAVAAHADYAKALAAWRWASGDEADGR